MFGLGIAECVAVLVVFMLLFGPRLMSQLGSRLAESLFGFQRALRSPKEEGEVC
ncbi:MAG: twin-arginine translocase TatA/TatE family subunit [Candidatus Eremiobacteraeota bacterium]|nr:twin-arginine translocase TatA/TatE family subunit [Candidatus Eremiobacteraeota bacterium]